jgi:hypothetical protein
VHVFHKKLKEFQMYDMCPNDDDLPPEPADWLYDAILKEEYMVL